MFQKFISANLLLLLSISQGQALRVSEKQFSLFNFSMEKILCQKTLTDAASAQHPVAENKFYETFQAQEKNLIRDGEHVRPSITYLVRRRGQSDSSGKEEEQTKSFTGSNFSAMTTHPAFPFKIQIMRCHNHYLWYEQCVYEKFTAIAFDEEEQSYSVITYDIYGRECIDEVFIADCKILAA